MTTSWMDLDASAASVNTGGPDHFGIDGVHNITITSAAVELNENFKKRELVLRGRLATGESGTFAVPLEPFDANDVDSIRKFADNFRTAIEALGLPWPEDVKIKNILATLPQVCTRAIGAVTEGSIVRKLGNPRKNAQGIVMMNEETGEPLRYMKENVYLRRLVKPAGETAADAGVAAVADQFGGTPAGKANDDDIPF